MTWYIGMYGIMVMDLLHMLILCQMCVCYMGLGSNGCFMASVALTGGHYRMDIISGVGHPRSDSVVPLMLCMVTYNIWGIGVVLLVPWDSANSTRNE
jgi:hypothetical protein